MSGSSSDTSPSSRTSIAVPQATGKRAGGSVYLHVSALPADVASRVQQACAIAGVSAGQFDVVKWDGTSGALSLLAYPGFFDEGFPALHAAWTVDLDRRQATHRTWTDGQNRPVLHRKEHMLAPDHPRRPEFEALTRAVEQAGLFTDRAIIGRSEQWQEELRARGLEVHGHQLLPRASAEVVLRHRTALSRQALSTPVQALWRAGLLDGDVTLFDYGCGRGDDIALLTERGVRARGWDPHFRPDVERLPADVVNLGFVLNVIEEPRERREALQGAWDLTVDVLAVAALIGGRTATERQRLYGDGVLTSRQTFQKYFTQAELGAYIAQTLGREPLSIAPGVFFVFRSDEAEQRFLELRQRSTWWAKPLPVAVPRTSAGRVAKVRAAKPDRWLEHATLAETFWQACLERLRLPEPDEFRRLTEVREHLGLPGRVLATLVERFGAEVWDEARRRRREDLCVYLALELLERRKSTPSQPESIKRTLRDMFGTLANAQDQARDLLFSAGRPDVLNRACQQAAAEGHGWFVPGDSLQVDASLVPRLPAVLRVYAGCASRLYGDVRAADVVKFHLRSRKLTVLHVDDFTGRKVPDLLERVKIDLARQAVDYFTYGGEFPVQPLWLKSRLQHPSCEGYAEQKAFDDALVAQGRWDFSGFGPERGVVEEWTVLD